MIWIPYRAAVLGAGAIGRAFQHSKAAARRDVPVPVELLEVPDLHGEDVRERVRQFGADLGVSLGAPVLKRALFSLPRLGTINLHQGKVPEFRGAPVGFWELTRDVTSIGATIHVVDDGLDTGPVLAAADAPIYPKDTLAAVQARAGELGSRLLRSTLLRLQRGDARGVPQPPSTGRPNRSPTLRQRAALGWKRWRRRNGARVLARRVAKWMAMVAAVYLYRPVRDQVRRLRRRQPVRVFTFHRVTSLCRDGMTVDADTFAEQIAYIARHHDIVPIREGIALIRSGARLARPAAVITFDDGYRSVFDAALPVLRSHGVAGCCFVCSDFVGTDRRFAHDEGSTVREHMDVMGWEELSTLLQLGWSIESHTATHARLSQVHGGTLRRELEDPRRVLRDHLGVDADVLAYPFGAPTDISREALDAAREAGYSVVFANFNGENRPGGQRSMLLHRIDLGGDHDALAWRMLSHGIDLGALRTIWQRSATGDPPRDYALAAVANSDSASSTF